MVPNVWLMDEENQKNSTENLKLVSPEGPVKTRLVHNNQLPLKNNPVEMVQESKLKKYINQFSKNIFFLFKI